jgi:NitT/TauT family transport system substrate-binding protein
MVNAPRELSSSAVSRRQLLRGTGIGLATLAFGSTLAACGDDTSPAAATSGGSKTMKYQLEWLKLTQFAGFFAGLEKGYYAQEGIKAEIAAGGPNISASQLVGAGRADLGDDDNITLLQGIDKGLPLMMFATVFQKTPYSCFSKSDKPIRTLQDMVGKTIAISAAGQAQLEPALKSAGVDPSKVKIIPAGADPTQLVTGQADGYFGFATDQGVALERKGLSLVFASATDLGFGGYADVLFTTKDNLAKNKDSLVKFLRGTIKGYEYTNQNPDDAATWTVKKYGPAGLDLENEKAVARKQVEFIKSPKGVLWLDPELMQKIIDAQLAIKSITKSVKAADVMTTELLEAAYGGKTSLLS